MEFLVLPGLGNSGPAHWQSVWQSSDPRYRRVAQRDWNKPRLSEWLAALHAQVAPAREPVVLVAHSLACALVAHWAQQAPPSKVIAAFLVAPADVESAAHTPLEVRNFAPLPLVRLPFAARVIASRNDPYVDFERAQHFAGAWGASFVDAGHAGHINADSCLGPWEQGQAWLAELLDRAA